MGQNLKICSKSQNSFWRSINGINAGEIWFQVQKLDRKAVSIIFEQNLSIWLTVGHSGKLPLIATSNLWWWEETREFNWKYKRQKLIVRPALRYYLLSKVWTGSMGNLQLPSLSLYICVFSLKRMTTAH